MRPLTVVGSVPVAYNFWICGTVQCKVHFTTNLAPVFTVGTASMMAVAVRGTFEVPAVSSLQVPNRNLLRPS